MQKLRLKIKSIDPNGSVVFVADKLLVTERYHIDPKTKKVLTGKQLAKAETTRVITSSKQVHPVVRFQLIPLEGDKTKYAVDDVYEVELKKVK